MRIQVNSLTIKWVVVGGSQVYTVGVGGYEQQVEDARMILVGGDQSWRHQYELKFGPNIDMCLYLSWYTTYISLIFQLRGTRNNNTLVTMNTHNTQNLVSNHHSLMYCQKVRKCTHTCTHTPHQCGMSKGYRCQLRELLIAKVETI